MENLRCGRCACKSIVSVCTRSIAWVLILPFRNCKQKFLRKRELYTFGIKMKPHALCYKSERAGLVKDCDSERCQYRQTHAHSEIPLLRMPFLCVYCQAPFCHKQDPLE